MSIEVSYLGIIAETAGICSESVEIARTKNLILESIMDKHPEFRKLNFVLSLNGTITHGDMEIKTGDQITLIPPPPGG
jgi:molybdopterin converting factor small subunit